MDNVPRAPYLQCSQDAKQLAPVDGASALGLGGDELHFLALAVHVGEATCCVVVLVDWNVPEAVPDIVLCELRALLQLPHVSHFRQLEGLEK